uniref:Uncharacterized protein n=1 Tax=Arundo donax TaxID=35708 RepID=A0A0A9B554_ARUDO
MFSPMIGAPIYRAITVATQWKWNKIGNTVVGGTKSGLFWPT